MTILYLARHGETVDNAAKIMQGQTHGQLNQRGVEQAEELARRLAGERIDAFVASDLRRAVQTAEIIAAPHGKAIDTTPLLRERDWGGFTGRYIPDLKDEPWPADVETLEQLLDRARRFIEHVAAAYPAMTVLAVGHGIINKAIQAVYHNKPMSEIQRMGNAEVRTLTIGQP